MATDSLFDVLEQALRVRQREGELILHCDRGSKYASICCSLATG